MTTPFVRLRQSALQENCERLAAQFAEAAIQWMPELSGLFPRDVLNNVRSVSTKASCRHLQDMSTLAAAGFTELCITKPITDLNALTAHLSRARQCELTFVADHFRQAELLSQAARDCHCSLSVLIDIECGRQLTGVRPGPDSARLAKAIDQLSGLRVAGVFADDESAMSVGCSAMTSPEIILSSTDHEIIASHSRRMIRANGVNCDQLVSGRFINPLEQQSSEITHCLLNPLERSVITNIPTGQAAAADMSRRSAWTVVARVLSRPTLETCVIDVGRSVVTTHATVIHPIGATLLQTSGDVSSLSLSNAALDLRIGDLVELDVDWRATLHLPVT